MTRLRYLPRRKRQRLSRRKALFSLAALAGTAAMSGCADDGEGESGGTSEGGDGDAGSESESSSAGDGDGATGDGDGDGEAYEVCQDSELTAEELLAGIEHIVVICMENRSFDHYFGWLSLEEGLPVNGLTGSEVNLDSQGIEYGPKVLTDYVSETDPPHSWSRSHSQWNDGANDRFVLEFEEDNPVDNGEVMGYYGRETLSTFSTIVDEFVLCDDYYCSVMSSTWPNRFHLHLGTSQGQQGNDWLSDQYSIFDECTAKGVSCGYYYFGLTVPTTYSSPIDAPFMHMGETFFEHVESGDLPSVVYVDPTLSFFNVVGNDDHPPADVRDGQVFVASIYEALAQSEIWDKTMLIVTYDEHGGYYDHVSPPTVVDAFPGFEQLGFRVPTLVAGGQVRRGCVNGTTFDHVSVLSTITKRFGLDPLNQRVADTDDMSSCIDPELAGNRRSRPPVRLPTIILPKNRPVVHPGKNYGGQMELLALLEKGDRNALRRWTKVSERGMEAIRHHSQRLGVAKYR